PAGGRDQALLCSADARPAKGLRRPADGPRRHGGPRRLPPRLRPRQAAGHGVGGTRSSPTGGGGRRPEGVSAAASAASNPLSPLGTAPPEREHLCASLAAPP